MWKAEPRERPSQVVKHGRTSHEFFVRHALSPSWRSTVAIRPTALTSRSGGPRRAKSDNRCGRRAARRARFHLGGTSSASGRREPGEVSSRAEMLRRAYLGGGGFRDHRPRWHCHRNARRSTVFFPLPPSVTGLNERTGRYSPGGDVDHLKRPCRCAASSCAVQRRLPRDIDPSGRRQVGRLEPATGVSTASCAGCLARHRNFPNVFSSSNRRGPSSGNGLPPQIHVMRHHWFRARRDVKKSRITG